MALYVVRAEVDIAGASETNFKSFSEAARILSKTVNLMHETGNARLTRRFQFTLDYVVPAVVARNWDTFNASTYSEPATATITYDSGSSVLFGNVHVIEAGEATADGENELVQRISFMAESRTASTDDASVSPRE